MNKIVILTLALVAAMALADPGYDEPRRDVKVILRKDQEPRRVYVDVRERQEPRKVYVDVRNRQEPRNVYVDVVKDNRPSDDKVLIKIKPKSYW